MRRQVQTHVRMPRVWKEIPVLVRSRFCQELDYPGKLGGSDWEDLPRELQASLTAVLFDSDLATDETDPDNRDIKLGRSKGKPVYRASMAGRCDQELLLYRIGMDQVSKAMADPKWTPRQLTRLKDKGILGAREGSRHEAWIIADLVKDGYEVTWHGESQRELERRFSRYVVRSHPDGMIRGKELGKQWHVLECKALNEDRWEQWRRDGWDGFENYAHQVSLEMDLSNSPAFFIVKNRNTGEHSEPALVYDPPIEPKLIYRKFSRIEDAFEEGILTSCPTNAEWFFCPFFSQGYCDVLKNSKRSGEVMEIKDEDLESLLEVFAEYKSIIKEATAAVKATRTAIVDRMVEWRKIKVGEYFVGYNERIRRSFDVGRAKEWIEEHEGEPDDFNRETGYEELRVRGPKTKGKSEGDEWS